jgi:hypothetical protein
MIINRHVLAAAAAVFLLAAGTARADINFDLTQGNTSGAPDLAGFSGPFAKVTIHLSTSTTATITFTSYTSTSGNPDCTVAHPCTYLLGTQNGTVAVNVNATSWTIGTFSPSTFSSGGAGNEDGWGSFNQTVNGDAGFNNAVSSASFVITNTSGTWSTESDVLKANASGFEAAAHIMVASSQCKTESGAPAACTTGFATDGGGGSTQSTVPEPTGIALLGGVLVFTVRTLREKLS